MAKRSSVILLLIIRGVGAQSVGSESTGADGALVLTTPGTVVFNPQAFNPPLNPSGDNVYHFTYIHIAKGVTVKLSGRLLTGAVFWLSQGPVVIDGTIDASGADGGRTPSIAGAGGYSGGGVRRKGYGPEESVKRNVFLVPLIGGSGGDGGELQGGGGGGGALLVASSAFIRLNGVITANGGASSDGTGGGGGAIRLVAPVIDGSTGVLSAMGGDPGGVDGQVRFETFDNRFTGALEDTPFSYGRPFGLFLPPDPPPSVRVVTVGGVTATGSEATVKQSGKLIILVEAHFMPPGTVIDVECFPQAGPIQTVATTPLEGTFALSRASAHVAFPVGASQCHAKANWKQPDRAQTPR